MIGLFLLALDAHERKRMKRAVISEDGLKWIFLGLLLVVIVFALYYAYLYVRKKEYEKIAASIHDLFFYNKNVMIGNKKLDQELLKLKEDMEKSEKKLEREIQRTKDLMMYLAHDLKTPLASVIGYLNLLGDITDLPIAQQKKFIGLALEKSERLEYLLEEFFDITRFGLHEVILYKHEVDLVLLIQQLIDEFYPIVAEKKQEIIYKGPESCMIPIDGEKIARVLNNLLKNASNYGNRHSAIEIELKQSASMMEIAVSNEGKEIPNDQLERLFEKFYRLDQSRSTQTGGSGLGLAIAKEIVEAHQGRIYAQSDEYKTIFIVELPIS